MKNSIKLYLSIVVLALILSCSKENGEDFCNDGIQNGNEAGIDCGGSCPPCPATFSKILDIGEESYVNGSISTQDDNIIVFGRNGNTNKTFFIMSDREGEIQWQKEHSIDASIRNGLETGLGDFLFVGSTGFGFNEDVLVLGVYGNGEIKFYHPLGFGQRSVATSIIKAVDGGYIVAALIDNRAGSVLLKFNENNQLVWRRDFNDRQILSLTDAGDGYVLCGAAQGGGTVGGNGIIIKTDYSGNTNWTMEVGDTGTDLLTDVMVSSQGVIYAVGLSDNPNNSFAEDMYFCRIEEVGGFVWEKKIAFPDYGIGNDILLTEDDHIIGVGRKLNLSTGEYNLNLVKLNSDGDIITNTIVQECSDGSHSMRVYGESDGGLLVVSRVDCFNTSDDKLGFFKFDENGEM